MHKSFHDRATIRARHRTLANQERREKLMPLLEIDRAASFVDRLQFSYNYVNQTMFLSFPSEWPF